ncbi:MAG TPA: CAP domain-containing protein, partial [Methylococcaceae bacterium]|nr:CAP domain-containing protein [Methylococcaceae bacterium]
MTNFLILSKRARISRPGLQRILLGVFFAFLPFLAGAVTQDQVNLLNAHNNLRAQAGKPALCLNQQLITAAEKYCQLMLSRGILDHNLNGSPGNRMAAEGYDWFTWGENIAQGQQSVTEVMNDWWASPGHHANIVGNFKEVG